jgi:hypothetical protein
MAHVRGSARIYGKSDPIDALDVARAVLREPNLTQARCHPDARAVLARRNAVGEKPSESSSADSPTSSTER